MTVMDLERSISFYTAMFDFTVRWKGQTSDGEPAALVGDDRSYVALFQATAIKKEDHDRPDYAVVGLNHFGFVVDDLAACRTRLAGLGITPHHDADYEPGIRLYFFDPDGIEIELVEYA